MINNPMEPPPEPDVGPETDLPLEAALTTPGDTDDSAGNETPPTEEAPPQATRFAPPHVALIVLGSVAFLYFARPVMLPILLAWMAATTLRPAVRWLSYLRLPTPVSAAVVFCLLLAAIVKAGVPRRVVIMDELPRSQIGKIIRRRVRDRIQAMEAFDAGGKLLALRFRSGLPRRLRSVRAPVPQPAFRAPGTIPGS